MMNCSALCSCHVFIQFFPCVIATKPPAQNNKSWPFLRQSQREWETGIRAIWQGMNLNQTWGCHKQPGLLREASAKNAETFSSRRAECEWGVGGGGIHDVTPDGVSVSCLVVSCWVISVGRSGLAEPQVLFKLHILCVNAYSLLTHSGQHLLQVCT